MKRLVAITRQVDDAVQRCELTHLARRPIDVEAVRLQHRRYEERLSELGCEVTRLPAEPELPDAVFVEDTAVVFPEVAVLTRPGAVSRRSEVDATAAVLGAHRDLVRIEEPGTLDGGDVLLVDREVFVGRSSRTNEAGIGQLRNVLERLGYVVTPVEVEGCLHLKSAVTRVGARTLLLNPVWVEATLFRGFERIDVDPDEPFAANALRIRETVLFPEAFRRTRKRLEESGFGVVPVDMTELAKAEGGVTCCSLIFPA
jgi:dimethylargininase